MGCICSTSRPLGSARSSQFDAVNQRSQPGRADGESSPHANLSALASLLDASHTLHHQLDADRSIIGEVLTPIQQEAGQLCEEIAERIHSGLWDSPPNALQDRLNNIRRDFNTIIAIEEGERLHYSGEFPTVSPPSHFELGQSVISLSGSLPGTP